MVIDQAAVIDPPKLAKVTHPMKIRPVVLVDDDALDAEPALSSAFDFVDQIGPSRINCDRFDSVIK